MAFTPVEIRHVRHPRGLLGYRREPVDRLLTEIADSFEEVWRDRADLKDKVEQLETDIAHYKELEGLLRATLVSAERTSHEVRDAAKRESETIVGEAQAEARTITREARAQREQLVREARRIRLLLSSALDSIDEYELLAEEPEAVARDAEAA